MLSHVLFYLFTVATLFTRANHTVQFLPFIVMTVTVSFLAKNDKDSIVPQEGQFPGPKLKTLPKIHTQGWN